MTAARAEFAPESDFDGYVYVLKCQRESDDETIYYVGTAGDMVERINDHLAAGGDFSGPAPEGYLAPKDEIVFEVYISDLETFTQSATEPDDRFQRRLWLREREKICEVAIDHETTQVFGG